MKQASCFHRYGGTRGRTVLSPSFSVSRRAEEGQAGESTGFEEEAPPMVFVTVAFKGVRPFIKFLSSTLTKVFISVDSKGS